MAGMRLIWTVRQHGWAICSVSDDHADAEAVASYVTDGPEQLLRAVAGVLLHETDTRAEFAAEPTVYRWFFHRDGATATDLGEAGYQTRWGRPFPRHELEALRAAWRSTGPNRGC